MNDWELYLWQVFDFAAQYCRERGLVLMVPGHA